MDRLTFLRGWCKKVFFLGFIYIYQVGTCLLQPGTIHDQSTISDIAFKEMIFFLNQCFDLIVKPRGVPVITDYVLIWNEILKNVEHGLVEKVCLLINIYIFKKFLPAEGFN